MLLTIYRNRSSEFSVRIRDCNGASFGVTASDVVYMKIGRDGLAPSLDLSSAQASANGSTMTAANPTVVKLAQADAAALAAGVHDLEFGVLDASDSDRLKHAEKGVCVVHATQAGDDGRSDFEG